MSEKIDETLKKLASDTKSGKTKTDPAGEHRDIRAHSDLAGDPNCPNCSGLGYLRFDVPIGHPDFGKVQVCSCRQGDISQQVRQRLFALSNLDALEHLTFENFQPRGHVGLRPMQADSLEQAYNQAHLFSQSLEGWLLIQGDYGCGKTHLAAAIANFAVSLGTPTLFITVPDLLDTMRFVYDDPETTFEERFDQVRNASLLVLDDFGTQNATSWAQEKLFQILNYRYINHLPTVVTTNLLLDEIEGRIRSRLEDPELVTRVQILAPDYRRPTYDASQPELSSLDLLHKMTFATFDLRKSEGLPKGQAKDLQKAFDTARGFAENPQGWLIFTGTYGCGKTHLAAAIANYRSDLGYPPLFVVVPDLLDHLRATFKPTSTISLDRRFEEIRSAPLLILDDLGTQSTTPWAREKLYQLFNYRYNAELPTIITTARYTDELDERLKSRMLDTRLCVNCSITAPSYRGTIRNSKKRRNY
ncbi:MAG: ATP-binding protein [Anaerolineales bacterium]|jgi:DNA replication protein DnaC